MPGDSAYYIASWSSAETFSITFGSTRVPRWVPPLVRAVAEPRFPSFLIFLKIVYLILLPRLAFETQWQIAGPCQPNANGPTLRKFIFIGNENMPPDNP
jgi:hypothetical protein